MAEWVFTYGSNMNVRHLKHWFCNYREGDSFPFAHLGIIAACRAELPNYSLAWNYRRKDGTGAANVCVSEGNGLVHGVALRVTDEVLHALDRKEGYYSEDPDNSQYLRKTEWITLDDGADSKVRAQLYVARVTEPIDVEPAHAYKDIVLSGAKFFQLPEAYVKSIESINSTNPKQRESGDESAIRSAPANGGLLTKSSSSGPPHLMYPVNLETAEEPDFSMLENCIAELKNDEFKALSRVFLRNLKESFELVMLPYQFLAHAEATRIAAQIETLESVNALDYLCSAGEALPADERERRLTQRLADAMQTEAVRDSIASQSHEFWLASLRNDEVMRMFAYKLLSASISFTWTTVESFGRDLWIEAVNQYPEQFASKCGTDASVTIGALSQCRFDISKSMGTILVGKFDFTNLKNTASSYEKILGKKFSGIAEALRTDADLLLTEKSRHLLQHKAGMIDAKFLKESNLSVSVGSQLPLDYKMAVSGIKAAARLGSRIVKFIDQLATTF